MSQCNSLENITVLTGDTEINETEGKTFRIKNYIPKRYKRKFLNPCLVICNIILFLIMLIIIIVKSSNRTSIIENIVSDVSHLSQKIILHDNDSIYFFYPSTKEYNLLYRGESTISAFTVYNKGIIFSIENYSSQIYYLPSESLNATHKNLTIIFEKARLRPYKMEIDYVSENLYIIDKEMGALIIFNMQTKYYNLLLNDLKSPSDIVIACTDRLIFIVLANSILRINMDGNQSIKIVENVLITAITVNEKETRIYWISNFYNIESSFYDGKDRKVFLTESFHTISLTIIENQLFWLLPAHQLSNATLLFSKTNNGTNISMPDFCTIDFSKDPKSIKYASYEQQNISNSFDHRCQHIGIQTSDYQFSCICNIGWQLHSYLRSCQHITDFLLYSTANYIRGRILNINKTSSLDTFWPIPYYTEILQAKKGINFDYDLENDDFYFSDDRHLYVMKLKVDSNQTILLTVNENTFVKDVAFDWLTGNLYYILEDKDYRSDTLNVFNIKLGNNFKKTLKTIPQNDSLSFNEDSRNNIIINPYRNVLLIHYNSYNSHNSYISLFNYDEFQIPRINRNKNEYAFIERINTNGVSEQQKISDSGFSFLVLGIDYTQEKLYRLYGLGLNYADSYSHITYSNFDGSEEKTFIVETVNDVKFIYIHLQWLYLGSNTGIWRVHKEKSETYKNPVEIMLKFEDGIHQQITGMKVISPLIQFTKIKNNSCAINRGNCEQFCFYDPKITCGCKDGELIQDDGLHCG